MLARPLLFTLICLLGVCCSLTALAQDQSGSQPATSGIAVKQREAALQLIATTSSRDQGKLIFPFDLQRRSDWHYTPRSRDGIAIKDMSAAQREAVRQLLAAPLTQEGLLKIGDQMALEAVLRETDLLTNLRVPENYAIAVFGSPSATSAWGWRIEGHHLSLHFTLDRDTLVASLPQFIGANPATVETQVKGGPKKGTRVLGAEEDAARALFTSLTAEQQKAALIGERTYGDLLSRNAASVVALERAGIGYAQLSHTQQEDLMKLVELFANHLKPALKEQRLAKVRGANAHSIRFAWVGATQIGRGHYFRIQSNTYLIEYDNSGGNHVHSVWRDFNGDWGRDVLAEHYRKAGMSKGAHRH